MANTLSGSMFMNLALGTSTTGRRFSGDISVSPASAVYTRNTQLIPTSATAMVLSNVTIPSAFAIKNLDATNYVDIISNTTGTTFLHILPGNTAMGYFPSTITAPAAKANTASVLIEYIICSP